MAANKWEEFLTSNETHYKSFQQSVNADITCTGTDNKNQPQNSNKTKTQIAIINYNKPQIHSATNRKEWQNNTIYLIDLHNTKSIK